MQPLLPWLTSLVLLAPPAAPAEDTSPQWHAVLRDLAGLDPVARQDRVREMLTRLDRANRVVLAPAELDRARARCVILARNVTGGKTLSQNELIELFREVDRQEKAAVELLARRFRIEVYRTFRQQRGTFTRRRAAWNRVRSHWETAGGRFDQQDRLLDWLELAISRSMPEGVGPLPAAPEFEVEPGSLEALAAQEPAEPLQRPPAASVPVPVASLAGPDRRLGELSRPRQPAVETPVPPGQEPVALAPASPRRAALGRSPLEHDPSGRPIPAAIRPSSYLPRIEERAAATVRNTIEPVAPLPIAEEPSDEPVSVEVVPERPSAVRVNLEELAAQIAGANLALKALQAELDEDRPWNARQLGPPADRLRVLLLRRSDLMLFYGLIAPAQRDQVGRLSLDRPVISQLAGRISEARARADRHDFPGTQAQRQAELEHLDQLSRVLAEMVLSPDGSSP